MLTNLARHHKRPFHAIEGIEWPFLVIFFLLAGITLELHAVVDAGILLVAYVALRVVGRTGGAWLAGLRQEGEGLLRRWLGVALLPQAGVAIGMALAAAARLPQHRETILAVALGSTVVFEIVGPVLTRMAIRNTGDAA